MRRKLISLILISVITCCLFAGCGSASQAQPDKTDEAKSETDEVKEASLKSENKSEEKTEEKSEEKAEEKSEEVPETVTGEKKDYEVSYAPVLNEVQKVVTSGYDYDKKYKYISDGLMEKCMYPGDGDLSEAVGYVLEDISGDDIPELIIGSELNISDDKFRAMMDDYEKQCKLLSWTPIGKYVSKASSASVEITAYAKFLSTYMEHPAMSKTLSEEFG